MNDQQTPAPDILFREEGRAGLITLNRPKALNALTRDMVRAMEAQYVKWATAPRVYGIIVDAAPGRAFCGGGDIRSLVEHVSDNLTEVMAFFRDEYQLNWSLECFTKPNVALIDGIVMGGGVGISIYGTHRVAGENFRFAMPEVGIGFFPDIGGGYFLARLPGEMGMYLALTGRSIGRADAYYLGIATHCIDATEFDKIRAAMIEGDPIDPALDGLHRDPGESELEQLRETVDRIFNAPDVETILERLDGESGAHAAWARETAAAIRTAAPLSLKVTFTQIRRAANLSSLKQALIVDYRLATAFVAGHDFREGVRAALIDKDRSPKWRPQTLAQASEATIAACFAKADGDELELKDRWTLVV